MNKPQKILLVIGILALIVPASLWYGANNGLLPVAASGEAELYDRLFNQLLTIATGLFLLIQGLIIFSAIRFRHRPGDNGDGPHIADNTTLELAWTAVPTMIVLWIGITSFDVYNVMHYQETGSSADIAHAGHNHGGMNMAEANAATLDAPLVAPGEVSADSQDMAETDADEVVVEVAGMQYAWIFTYPGTDIVSGELHLPVGRKARINLTANDVIHAFWVPQLRMKQDAVPGQATHMEFKPNQVGEYPIVCAELCGAYHGGMRAQMFVQTPEDYAAWLIESQETASSDLAMDKALAIAPNQRAVIAPQEILNLENSLKNSTTKQAPQIAAYLQP
jgi:cytochrome c oxidase subunit II